ncbi:hypothetical protein ACJX0J_033399, partial [Zea mays]
GQLSNTENNFHLTTNIGINFLRDGMAEMEVQGKIFLFWINNLVCSTCVKCLLQYAYVSSTVFWGHNS